MGVAFLLKCRQYNLASAFELVRAQRPCAMPNFGFWRQLEAFEEQYRSPGKRPFSTGKNPKKPRSCA